MWLHKTQRVVVQACTGHLWGPMGAFRGFWGAMGAYGDLRGPMVAFGDL